MSNKTYAVVQYKDGRVEQAHSLKRYLELMEDMESVVEITVYPIIGRPISWTLQPNGLFKEEVQR